MTLPTTNRPLVLWNAVAIATLSVGSLVLEWLIDVPQTLAQSLDTLLLATIVLMVALPVGALLNMWLRTREVVAE